MKLSLGLRAHVHAVKAASAFYAEYTRAAFAAWVYAARQRAEYHSAVKAARAYSARLRAAYKGEGWTAAILFGVHPGAVKCNQDGKIIEILCEDPWVLTCAELFENIKVVEARWFDWWVGLS